MAFEKDEFAGFAIENGVVDFSEDPLTLSSGKQSHWYANWRVVAEDAYLLEKLAGFVLDFVKDNELEVDTFYGVPEGGTKLAVLTQYLWAKEQGLEKGSHVVSMGRGKSKHHGRLRDRHFLGLPRGKTVVLEDVTTTGGSLLKAVEKLDQVNVDVSSVITLTDRSDGSFVKDLERKGISYLPMLKALDFVPLLEEKGSRAAEAILEEEG